MTGARPTLVAVLRHPDDSNLILVDGPELSPVTVIDMDLGRSFDGRPGDRDEADIAIEMADLWESQVAYLPDGRAKAFVLDTARSLRRSAEDVLEEYA